MLLKNVELDVDADRMLVNGSRGVIIAFVKRQVMRTSETC